MVLDSFKKEGIALSARKRLRRHVRADNARCVWRRAKETSCTRYTIRASRSCWAHCIDFIKYIRTRKGSHKIRKFVRETDSRRLKRHKLNLRGHIPERIIVDEQSPRTSMYTLYCSDFWVMSSKARAGLDLAKEIEYDWAIEFDFGLFEALTIFWPSSGLHEWSYDRKGRVFESSFFAERFLALRLWNERTGLDLETDRSDSTAKTDVSQLPKVLSRNLVRAESRSFESMVDREAREKMRADLEADELDTALFWHLSGILEGKNGSETVINGPLRGDLRIPYVFWSLIDSQLLDRRLEDETSFTLGAIISSGSDERERAPELETDSSDDSLSRGSGTTRDSAWIFSGVETIIGRELLISLEISLETGTRKGEGEGTLLDFSFFTDLV
uniref:Chymotrypsin-like serine protease n=1 Tax=Myxobolus cerebralis TaxID=59783 RepID=Q7Z2B7_9CNID|nr:chymotrypsin-like serine protease [Myxobolus cerebralis]